MKFHFCQNDRNELSPAMSFISVLSCKQFYIDQTARWKYFLTPKMKTHVNTLLIINISMHFKIFIINITFFC